MKPRGKGGYVNTKLKPMDKPKSIIMFDAVGGNQRVYDAVEADKIFESLEKQLEEAKGMLETSIGQNMDKESELQKLREENERLHRQDDESGLKDVQLETMQFEVKQKESELQKLREAIEGCLQHYENQGVYVRSVGVEKMLRTLLNQSK